MIGDIIGLTVIAAIAVGFFFVIRSALREMGIVVKPPNDPLDDPRVEWEVTERTSIIGSTEWVWYVAVADKRLGHSAWHKLEAINDARQVARLLLGGAERIGKTRTCPLCGQPARPGNETDTDECAALLAKARAELPKAVL